MRSLNALPVHELNQLLQNGECSSVDIVSDVISAIERVDDRIGAYLDYDGEHALKEARASDERRSNGCQLPLLGIPVGLKDVLNVRGMACGCASRILEGYTSPYDAYVVTRLREAGAVILGRLNMDEFAMGSTNENSAYKPTRNPWNQDYVPGGSSGGSAAAVSACEAVAALGSDTGGSIRQPASFCGCVGLKPTYGRVSRRGLTAFASSLDQVGPVVRDVRDAALLLEVIAGHDRFDSTSLNIPLSSYRDTLTGDISGMKLGIPKEYFIDGMDPDVKKTVQDAIDKCAELGAELVDVELPHTEYAVAVYYIIATAEASANLARFDGVRYGARVDGRDPLDMYGKTRAGYLGDEVKRRIILGTYVLSSGYYDEYYIRAQKARTLIRNDFENAFGTCDALIAPVTPTTSFRFGEKGDDPLQMYLGDIFTVPVNLAGICGISVPCGMSGSGLPIGLQIIGPAFKEERILRAAHAYEQATDWHNQKPEIARTAGMS